jgi:hypothetical protein
MSNLTAIEIADSNAEAAIDQVLNFEDSISSYARNVRDTLEEKGLKAFEREAIARYYRRVSELIENS